MYICKEKNYKRKKSGMADLNFRFFNKNLVPDMKPVRLSVLKSDILNKSHASINSI